MARPWEADPTASFALRLGKTAKEAGISPTTHCPDIWELDNGDVAVIGRDMTAVYSSRLPPDVTIAVDERLVVVPGSMFRAAKQDVPRVE
ncbi:hypothetical protein ACFOVU_07745 [Nocardiopsis sediminis]|uniref:Amidohydrolase 3 domain-containing protein n=1 Tax=Nocardiopsis sediminis TaxID=1778267 RepID=A0ABV8FLF2_9ACTN